MASTYSSLKIQLMATGENSGTWGTVTNVNLGTALEEAIVGSADVTFASANVTLTLTDTNTTQTARNLRLNLTGTTAGARDLIVPAIEKIYIVNNGCADTVTIKVTGQTGVAVPAGKTMYVYNNGTDCGDAITHLRSLTLATALPVASGGTGSNTATFSGANITSLNASSISSGTLDAGRLPTTGVNAETITVGTLAVARGGTGASTLTAENVIIGNTTGAVKFVAPGTTGNVLTSNGSAWLSQAAGAGGGDYIMSVFTSTSPGQVWTKPANLKAIKVTVIGGGGSGNVGSGGTSSFGSPALLSATGGSSSVSNASNVAGAGSGGDINSPGSDSIVVLTGACGSSFNGWGGASAFGFAGFRKNPQANNNVLGYAYGGGGVGASTAGGGGGGAIEYIDAPALPGPGPQPVTVGAGGANPAPTPTPNRSTGGNGIVIVEEFY